MSGHEELKREILNDLKPIMLECVEGWLSKQKDTLMIQLIGMLEHEKWEKENAGLAHPPSKPIKEDEMGIDFRQKNSNDDEQTNQRTSTD